MYNLFPGLCSVGVGLFALPLISLAMPVVSDNILTWPADGWYQVQRADNFETICEGIVSADSSLSGGPCVIDDVTHIVINHTTGERFDDITALGTSTSVSTVLVEGSRISWPADGWYQVQNATSFATVCEGGRGCDVAAGNYLVINHTTGERFENVVVGSSLPTEGNNNPSVGGVTVTGQMITWPDNGWYQVQNAANFSTVCEGGTSCTVQPGTYVVINHSTGERFNGVEVDTGGAPDNSTGNNSPSSVMLFGTTIRWPNDGWYQVQNSSGFATVCEGGTECEVSPGTYFVINHTSDERTLLEVTGNSTTGGSTPDPLSPNTTRVEFNITVPAYQSNALQVHLVWGDLEFTGRWNRDELWTVSAELPADTNNRLMVSFNDRNGEITLGSFETDFRTGSSPSESFAITADQFDTNRWDNDSDGVSNLNELIAGTNPGGSGLPQPVQASLELLPVKTFRIAWQTTPNAQYYRVFENPDGVSGFTDVSGQLEANRTSFDHTVALHLKVNAEYVVQSCNELGCVDSEAVMVTGTLDDAIGYVKSSNTVPDSLCGDQCGDAFGRAVSLSADGNTLAIGAINEDSAATGINGDQNDNSSWGAGAVYVFVRNEGRWQQQAYIKSSNTEASDAFGGALSLSADGNTLAVGARNEDSAATGINGDQADNSLWLAGAAYVFVRSGETWQQQAYVKASNTGSRDNFGESVSVSADGNTLVVAATGEASSATGINGDESIDLNGSLGAAYVFVRIGGLWQQQAYVKASTPISGFGHDVSLSEDGNTLAVASVHESSNATGINGDQQNASAEASGAVYVFVRNAGLWRQQAYIKASNTEAHDFFGDAVSLSADGNTLAVGARHEDSAATGVNGDQNDNSEDISGAAYVFVRSGEIWQQQAYIKASNTDRQDGFGSAVSLSADSNILAIGAAAERSNATGINGNQTDYTATSGAVYVFVRSDGLWQQRAYVKASNTEHGDGFSSASLSADGSTLAVGAGGEDSSATGIDGDQTDNSAVQSGAVYLY